MYFFFCLITLLISDASHLVTSLDALKMTPRRNALWISVKSSSILVWVDFFGTQAYSYFEFSPQHSKKKHQSPTNPGPEWEQRLGVRAVQPGGHNPGARVPTGVTRAEGCYRVEEHGLRPLQVEEEWEDFQIDGRLEVMKTILWVLNIIRIKLFEIWKKERKKTQRFSMEIKIQPWAEASDVLNPEVTGSNSVAVDFFFQQKIFENIMSRQLVLKINCLLRCQIVPRGLLLFLFPSKVNNVTTSLFICNWFDWNLSKTKLKFAQRMNESGTAF